MIHEPRNDCAHVQDQLDDYRRGSLAVADRQQVQVHLEQCSACMAELNFRMALSGHLRASLPLADAPLGLSPAVRAAVQAPRHKLAHNDRKMVLLPWTFAAAVIIIFAVAFFRNRPEEPFGSSNTVAFNLPQASDSVSGEMEKAQEAPLETASRAPMAPQGTMEEPDSVVRELSVVQKEELARPAVDTSNVGRNQSRAGAAFSPDSTEAKWKLADSRPASIATTAALTSATVATTTGQAATSAPLNQVQDRQDL